MGHEQAKYIGRRAFGIGSAALGLGFAVRGLDQFAGSLEQLANTSATIGFAEGQEVTSKTKSGVLVLPGQFIRSTKDVATALSPSLSALGTVMYAKYGNTGIDLPGLENDLYGLQDRSKMKTLSLYCDSDGLDIAGELIPKIGDRFNINYIFADCSPYDISDAKLLGLNDIAEFYLASPYGQSAFLTGAFEQAINHNPVAAYLPSSNLAPPGLADDQGESLDHAGEINDALGEYVKRNNASGRPKIKIVFLRPENPAADTDVNVVQSEKQLKRVFPNMKTVEIGGYKQGHNNPVINPGQYNNGIGQIIAQLG